jgi:subtilisin family serine protease
MKVLVQLQASAVDSSAADMTSGLTSQWKDLISALPEIALDPNYLAEFHAEVQTSSQFAVAGMGNVQTHREEDHPMESVVLVRGDLPDDPVEMEETLELIRSTEQVVEVFSDPTIETGFLCANDPAQGTDADVAALLGSADLLANGLDGSGVSVAVVDTGINIAHLQTKGRQNALEVAESWNPRGVTTAPGQHPVNHGTMCAFDVGIVAPLATLLDHSVLLSRAPGGMAGLLSDAVLSYSSLLQTLLQQSPQDRRLVISNSWGMYSPRWDFPVGQPGNYSHSVVHPFFLVTNALIGAGADVLFASGNCGAECPDGRCGFGAGESICGANSYPNVLSVAGVSTTKERVGYSSQGPGVLSARKPDLAGYTHFAGSGVWPVDSGTSAACPVLAGYVAAIRTRYSSGELSPIELQTILYKTAEDLGTTGFDFDCGWGVPDAGALLAKLP